MQNPEKVIANIVKIAKEGIEDKKGNNILTLRFDPDQSSICDFFIICDVESDRQAKAISNYLEKKIKDELKLKPASIEGFETAQWILLDYFDVIIHIFQKEYRDFYSLEKLWADAEIIRN